MKMKNEKKKKLRGNGALRRRWLQVFVDEKDGEEGET